MAYTYEFETHLREHRPSRLGQRLWWLPAAVGVCMVIADAIYLAATPSDQLSAAVAVPPLFVAAFLFLLASAALSIAHWTYQAEKRYREAQHVAACQARAYILAGRRTRDRPTAESTPPNGGRAVGDARRLILDRQSSRDRAYVAR